ncbi:hypothetical protein CCACVL1_27556, partial [Corchorus capsularis]
TVTIYGYSQQITSQCNPLLVLGLTSLQPSTTSSPPAPPPHHAVLVSVPSATPTPPSTLFLFQTPALNPPPPPPPASLPFHPSMATAADSSLPSLASSFSTNIQLNKRANFKKKLCMFIMLMQLQGWP